MSSDPGDVSQLLRAWGKGDVNARESLVPLVYHELRRRAGAYLRRERPDHTLQPTALVHEAYVRLIGQDRVDWQNRAHFFGLASEMMRRILVDHAREHQAAKRPGAWRSGLPSAIGSARHSRRIASSYCSTRRSTELAAIDPRQAQIVEMSYFGGFSEQEVAGRALDLASDGDARLAGRARVAFSSHDAWRQRGAEVSDAGRWAQVTAVFQEALDRDDAARARVSRRGVCRRCALRAEVESLLAAHQAAGRFAEGSPLEALPPSAVEALGVNTRLPPGSRLGSYEIAALLGARAGWARCIAHATATLNRDVAVKVLPDLFALGSRSARALHARSADSRRAQPSRHRHRAFGGGGSRRPLHHDGAGQGADPRRAAAARRLRARSILRHCHPPGRGGRRCPRAGDRAS